MGDYKCQFSVKILAICQLLVKFKSFYGTCKLSVKWLLTIHYETYLYIIDVKLRHI